MQLFYKLTLGTFLMLWAHTSAEVLRDEASLNNLYNNLLQREYAGPVVFPNHQVERKAQRSPSLRLRFGRRSDPDVLTHAAAKRWFGDVNQKPIRSPSLRLRFGRRSDPSMPMHSPLDMLMNDDYNDIYDTYFNRLVRKPQRLRFGRSLPYEAINEPNDLTESDYNEDIDAFANNDDDINKNLKIISLLRLLTKYAEADNKSQKLIDSLRSLTKYAQDEYGSHDNEELATAGDSMEENVDEFERAIRKPGGGRMRLRWGRSTGSQSSVDEKQQNMQNMEQKDKVSINPNDVDKSISSPNKN